MKLRYLCVTLVLLALAIPACMRAANSQIVGKWEATLLHKRSNTETKMFWEFMPDGTFTAAPWVDPGTIVDKDKYEVSADGQTVKIRSQLVDNATCTFEGSAMFGETPEYTVKFKKL
jgi:hypothetical protein